MNTSVLNKTENKTKSNNYAGIDQLIHDVLFGEQRKPAKQKRNIRPNTNIIDREKEVLLELAVPGIAKKDIQLQVQKLQLKVFSASDSGVAQESSKYIRKGFDYKSFERYFTLSEEINTEKIKASYKQGVLSIHLPKKESFGPKQIIIK